MKHEVEEHEVFVMCELWYWLARKRTITALKCSGTVWGEGGGGLWTRSTAYRPASFAGYILHYLKITSV
jgi:hypothetical protein